MKLFRYMPRRGNLLIENKHYLETSSVGANC